nr:immunoglobulin light chain junction region [Macaca mulatta]
CQQHNDYPFTF